MLTHIYLELIFLNPKKLKNKYRTGKVLHVFIFIHEPLYTVVDVLVPCPFPLAFIGGGSVLVETGSTVFLVTFSLFGELV